MARRSSSTGATGFAGVPTLTTQERQVVSRKRVSDHGEVYTAKREVTAMLDLVKQETTRIDSRFLEPACGNSLSRLQHAGQTWPTVELYANGLGFADRRLNNR